MARLIDADKVFERADEVTFMGFRAEERKKHFMDLVSEIMKQSTVDAVPVVPCTECKWKRYRGGKDNGYFFCMHKYGLRVIGDISAAYCSRGERSEENENQNS